MAPSLNEEYLFYQTLVGSWPIADDAATAAAYRERIEAFMIKALREAKVSTSWANPNTAYESAVTEFVKATLTTDGRNPFRDDLSAFVRQIAVPGFLNSLGQTLLKLTSPGVPDIYQGNEVWDFSLVDPDNRRPVDYELRDRLLAQLESASGNPADVAGLVKGLWDDIADGRAKLYLIWRTLQLRAAHAALFELGTYLPLQVRGARAEHICAFARQHDGATVVVAVGRWFTKLSEQPADWPRTPFDWGDTEVLLPSGGTYQQWLAGERLDVAADDPCVRADRLFTIFPAALLLAG